MRRGYWSACLVVAGLLVGCTALPGVQGNSKMVTATDPVTPPAVEQVTLPSAPPVPAKPIVPDMNKLKARLNEYLAEQDGTYGVYVIDLTSGKALGINSDKVFPAASTFKLPMSLYILDLASQGKVDLDEKIPYTDADFEDGTGTLQDTVYEGDQYTVRDLIRLAITQSDNIATHMLLRHFGSQNVYDYMLSRLGGKVTEFDAETIGTTPRDMAIYMRGAQGSRVVKDPALREFLIDCLEHTAFEDRTAAGVPDGVAVAHKIGTLPNVVNDVALVMAPDHPFILSAFSMDVDDEQAPQVIADMTREVYDFLNNS
jgi:beta-lactamase class A